ncbi:MAG: hypothetical protein WBF89_10460 [Steroidobacteraceae bacterium]
MADINDTSHPPAQTANPQRVSPDGTPGRRAAGEEKDGCPLWDGHIIDAVFPPE